MSNESTPRKPVAILDPIEDALPAQVDLNLTLALLALPGAEGAFRAELLDDVWDAVHRGAR
jgi:hypothetical protein